MTPELPRHDDDFRTVRCERRNGSLDVFLLEHLDAQAPEPNRNVPPPPPPSTDDQDPGAIFGRDQAMASGGDTGQAFNRRR